MPLFVMRCGGLQLVVLCCWFTDCMLCGVFGCFNSVVACISLCLLCADLVFAFWVGGCVCGVLLGDLWWV